MKVIAGKKLETKPEIKSATNNKKENKDRKVILWLLIII